MERARQFLSTIVLVALLGIDGSGRPALALGRGDAL
jgi:hypothetical protein